MPPKKPIESKRTSLPPSTTATSHTFGDHHHLRHTGPSTVGTRARTSTTSSKPPAQPAIAQETSEKKPLAEVSPTAGARTPLSKSMYVLLFCMLLFLGWYIHGMVILLERLKDDVGWWDIVVGDSGAEAWKGSERAEGGAPCQGGDLEGPLNALANALGMSPVQVASAVKPLVPQASLTNIALRVKESGCSEAVRVLIADTTPVDGRMRTGIVDEGEDEAEQAFEECRAVK